MISEKAWGGKGAPDMKIAGPTKGIKALAWSHDGTRLAAGSYMPTVVVWELR